MIIKNNDEFFQINHKGEFIIEDKIFKIKNSDCKNLVKQLSAFSLNNSVELADIPDRLQDKITKALDEIVKGLDKKDNSDILVNKKIEKLGLLEEQRKKLQELISDIRKKAYSMGLGNIEKNYLKSFNYYDEIIDYNELKDKKQREHIALFIADFKNSKSMDFGFFYETMTDLGVENTKEILELYNDKIDSAFKLNDKEFNQVSLMKRDLMELQMGIIETAQKEGYGIPKDLIKFASPSNKIKDETINPQKLKMIANWDFEKNNNDIIYKNDAFLMNGNLSSKGEEIIIEQLAKEVNILNIDSDNCVGMINTQLVKNNGFNLEDMKNWAMMNKQNNILSPQRAMSVATSGVVQCNKLVDCGILQTSDGKNYTFTSPKAREILFENLDASYNKLADLVIKEHSISFSNSAEKNINKKLFDEQMGEMIEFLDSQFKTYYLPQGKEFDISKFKEDILEKKSEESQRFLNVYKELSKGISFEKFVSTYCNERKEYDTSNKLLDWQKTALEIIDVSKTQLCYKDKDIKEIIDCELNLFGFENVDNNKLKDFLYSHFEIKDEEKIKQQVSLEKEQKNAIFIEKLEKILSKYTNKNLIDTLTSLDELFIDKNYPNNYVKIASSSAYCKDKELTVPMSYDSLTKEKICENLQKINLPVVEDIIDVEIIEDMDVDYSVSGDERYEQLNNKLLENFKTFYLNNGETSSNVAEAFKNNVLMVSFIDDIKKIDVTVCEEAYNLKTKDYNEFFGFKNNNLIAVR
jgi:hypothetical protein